MIEHIPLNALMVIIPAAFAGFAAAVAWLDNRAKQMRVEIEAEAAETAKELRSEIQQLREEIGRMRGAHIEARGLAIEGISETSDPKSRERFTAIARVLG